MCWNKDYNVNDPSTPGTCIYISKPRTIAVRLFNGLSPMGPVFEATFEERLSPMRMVRLGVAYNGIVGRLDVQVTYYSPIIQLVQ